VKPLRDEASQISRLSLCILPSKPEGRNSRGGDGPHPGCPTLKEPIGPTIAHRLVQTRSRAHVQSLANHKVWITFLDGHAQLPTMCKSWRDRYVSASSSQTNFTAVEHGLYVVKAWFSGSTVPFPSVCSDRRGSLLGRKTRAPRKGVKPHEASWAQLTRG
jgi:hypothetical protein